MKRSALVLLLVLLATAPAFAQTHFGVAHIDDRGVLHLRKFANATPRTDELDIIQIDKSGKPVAKKVKVTHQVLSETVLELDASIVQAFDGAGKEVAATDLAKRLGKDTPVVLLDAGQRPNAALTTTLKKETVVLALPFSLAALQARPLIPVPATTTPVPLPVPIPPR